VLATIEPEKLIGFVRVLLHRIWSEMAFKPTVGFTVMLKTIGKPLQLLDTGVTVKRAVMGILLKFVEVNEMLLPDPEAPIPMPELSLVQL
jgi:hypothetical protein